MKTIRSFVLICACLFLLCGSAAHAALPDMLDIEDLNALVNTQPDLNITINPQYPAPFNTVTASLEPDSQYNSSAVEVAWMLDGKVISGGAGESTFTFKAGELGESMEVVAVIQSDGAPLRVARATVIPSRVTLLTEAQTYTPPFYKGRAQYSAHSVMRLVAIAEIPKKSGAIYSPQELVYTWSQDGKVLQKSSGLGRSSIELEGPGFLGSDLVEVSVKDPSGNVRGHMGAVVISHTPKIVLYEKKPLTGIEYFHALINKSTVSGPDVNIVAEPYFSDVTSRNASSLKYKWQVNGVGSDNQDKQSELLLRSDASAAEQKLTVSVAVQHVQNLIQNVRASFELYFGDATSNFIF